MSGEDTAAPTPEQVRAWMRNHVCVPKGGVPQSFIDAEQARMQKPDAQEPGNML